MPGFDAKTVEPLKAALICPECNMLLRDAVQTGDGIRLCESCFDQILQYPNHSSPKSGTTIGKEYYLDKAVRREISQLLVLCSYSIYGCHWQGQLQHFESHCQDCKYKMKCSNLECSESIPAKKLDSHADGDGSFRKVACNYCREETTTNQLEDHLNQCPKVPVECGRCPKWFARDALKEHQQRDSPYVECPAPGCGEILLRNGTEKEPNTIASHLTNPLILLQHMVALLTYFGNGKANGDVAGGSETIVSQVSYTSEDVPASVDPMGKINSNKVRDSKAIIPGVTPSIEDFRSTFLSLLDPRCLMDRITTTLGETLNPLVAHLCSQAFSKVQFGRMRYEPVDDPSDRLECPEAFIPSNILHHMKKKHHLGRYADFFGYHKERELRRDIETLLQHIRNCKKTASVPSQWEQLCILLDNAIKFLTGIEAGLQRNMETRLCDEMSAKIDELTKMKAEIELLCAQMLTPKQQV